MTRLGNKGIHIMLINNKSDVGKALRPFTSNHPQAPQVIPFRNHLQKLRRMLWKRFVTEYLMLFKYYNLNEYNSGRKINLKEGDIVIVKDKVIFQH